MEPVFADRFRLRMRCIELACRMTRNGIPIHEANRLSLRLPNEERLAEYTRIVEETALELGWNRAKPKFSHWFDSDELRKDGKPKKARAYVAEAVPFNPESGHHWTELVIGKMGRVPLKFTKKSKEPAWDEEVLGHLIADPDPRLSKLARYGQKAKAAAKELANYIVGLPVWQDGRIHPYWAAMDAVTGRWTCNGPAAQTFPRHLRSILSVPTCPDCGRRGWVVCTDWSQQEPRLMSLYAADPILIENYKRGLDIYKTVAQPVFGVPYNAVSALQRQAMKVDFLSMCYGAGIPTRLAALHGASETFRYIDFALLARMTKAFLKEHPWIQTYQHRCEDEARSGVIKELLGGHELHTYGHVDPAVDYNFKIQASGAYMMAVGILEVDSHLSGPPVGWIYQNNHDEIVTGSLREDPMEIVAIHRTAMERDWTIGGNTLRFTTETKLSSDSVGHAIEVLPDGRLNKPGTLAAVARCFDMRSAEGCSTCLRP